MQELCDHKGNVPCKYVLLGEVLCAMCKSRSELLPDMSALVSLLADVQIPKVELRVSVSSLVQLGNLASSWER